MGSGALAAPAQLSPETMLPLSLRPLLAFGGFGGLALGLAVKELATNIVSGTQMIVTQARTPPRPSRR